MSYVVQTSEFMEKLSFTPECEEDRKYRYYCKNNQTIDWLASDVKLLKNTQCTVSSQVLI